MMARLENNLVIPASSRIWDEKNQPATPEGSGWRARRRQEGTGLPGAFVSGHQKSEKPDGESQREDRDQQPACLVRALFHFWCSSN
jgi:hypothetical protein